MPTTRVNISVDEDVLEEFYDWPIERDKTLHFDKHKIERVYRGRTNVRRIPKKKMEGTR